MIAIFLYNILLIVLYSLTMAIAIFYYIKDHDKLDLMIAGYLGFFILDNTVIYMTEFLTSFAHSYNEIFMSVPIAKTIIFLANGYFMLWLATRLTQQKMSRLHYALLILLAIWLSSVPLLPNSALQVWLYYLPNQLLLFYIGFYLLRQRKKTTLPAAYYLKSLQWLALASALAILIEDTFVIFNVDVYNSLVVKIFNRNICEDLFSIIICVLILRYYLKDRQKAAQSADKAQEDDAALRFQNFCRHYQFTQRETEIFSLLLSHKQNQEIADALFLSIGTVKTHVHNIFIKLEIKKRTQIFPLYEDFQATTDSTETAKLS